MTTKRNALHSLVVSTPPSHSAATPCTPEEWFALGITFTKSQNYIDAELSFRRALELAPHSLETLLNLGYVLGEQGKTEEALGCYESVLAEAPGNAKARYNRAAHLLRRGELAAGFADYEARFAAIQDVDCRVYPQPRWDGSPLNGRSILVYCEQGFGDAILFGRYVPLLAGQGGKVVLEAQPPLLSLLATLPGVDRVVAKSANPPVTDCHIPLLSLPHLFGTTLETIPVSVPYLFPSESLASVWRARTASEPGILRIGLVWAGKERPYPNRSCPPEYLVPLLATPGVRFFSLQIGERERFPLPPEFAAGVIDHTDGIRDFADTAALILTLDLVITIDSAVAHLAGALGKPVWILLPCAADWRWLEDRSDSPWYPTMRLFRQPGPGDWGAVLNEVTGTLRDVTTHEAVGATLTDEQCDSLFRGAMESLEQNVPDAAVAQFLKLLPLFPDNPAVWFNLGRARRLQRNRADAEKCFRRALLLKPDSPDIWLALGRLYLELKAFEEAEACLGKAHELAPGSVDILLDLGAALVPQGKTTEAFCCDQKILAIKPDCTEAIYNMGFLQLRSGDFLPGFANFEQRLSIERFQIDPRIYPQQRWDGSPLAGRTILVFGEQGMGDSIQFSRYIPLIAQRGGTVVFEVEKPLVPLFNSLPGVAQVVPKSGTPPATDVYIQSLSLPHIFHTTIDTVPNRVPYLAPEPSKVAAWRQLLAGDSAFRVGLVWRGNPRNPLDQDRSSSLAAFSPLAALDGVSYYSLQVGPAAEEAVSPPAGMEITDLTSRLEDFSDTAALIANLDLVISIETAVAHLAGALGRPVWVLLSHNHCWRWLVGRDDSPWYPTMHLFRQERPGDWGGAVQRVKNALESLVRERAN
ncbi:tetratricopeptide repeat protein [Oryzomonas rubra]|nr:tetratricopeptide repeat protein [Oryzomonas rubra]